MTKLPEPPNGRLIGAPLSELSTPCLLVDRDAFERNLSTMTAHAEREGVALRPHAKTHKCATIAKAQIATGAIGVCCAKLGEAEIFAGEGVRGILLTSPIVTKPMIRRLMDLLSMAPDTMVVVDNEAVAMQLNEAALAKGAVLDVLVDLDVGTHRTGIAPATALSLGKAIEAMSGLRLRGLQAYAGHVMHVESLSERRQQSHDALEGMRQVRDAFKAAGLSTEILTGAGTGTYDIDPELGLLTELQVGSYIFMDRQYRDVEGLSEKGRGFEPALYVLTTVISNNTSGLVTTDAGLKAFATEDGPPTLVAGAPDGSKYFYFGDEQGGVILPKGHNGLPIGTQIKCVVPHCDPTVNLYDWYHVISDGRLEALWRVDARGQVS